MFSRFFPSASESLLLASKIALTIAAVAVAIIAQAEEESDLSQDMIMGLMGQRFDSSFSDTFIPSDDSVLHVDLYPAWE